MIHIITVEWQLLMHRRSSWSFLLLSALLAILVTLFFHFLIGTESNAVSDNLNRALSFRNFYLLPLLFMLCASSSLAEDRQLGQLKEVLCLPISRHHLLWSKLTVLCGLSAASLILTALPSLFFIKGEIGNLKVSLGAYLISFCSDLLLIELCFIVATFVRTAGAAAIATFFFFVADGLLRAMLSLSTVFFEKGSLLIELGPQIAKWMPGSIIGSWKIWDDQWHWGYPLGLLLFIVLFGIAMDKRFSKLRL